MLVDRLALVQDGLLPPPSVRRDPQLKTALNRWLVGCGIGLGVAGVGCYPRHRGTGLLEIKQSFERIIGMARELGGLNALLSEKIRKMAKFEEV